MPGLRILVASPYVPSRRSGGPVRVLGLIRALARSHAVSLVCFDSGEDDAARRDLRTYCDAVDIIHNPALADGRGKRALQLRSLLDLASFERLAHEHPALQDVLDGAGPRSFDVVQVEACFMAHFRFPSEAAVVLDEHNVEYDVLRRTAAISGGAARRLYNAIDSRKLRVEEERTWRRVDACAATSPRDEALVSRAAPGTPTAVVPNGADTSYFVPAVTPEEPDSLLFFGALDYYPNVDGLEYLLREVMPRIRSVRAGVRLMIVGRSAPRALLAHASRDVVFAGAVDDVRPYLARAAAVVTPLRIGGGTRLKIVEALAMAKPVVSTRVGAEGLDVTDTKDVLLADDPAAFASRVLEVLRDRGLATRLGEEGRALVERRYSWEASADRLVELHRRAIGARSTRRAAVASALAREHRA